jgi:endonuclease G
MKKILIALLFISNIAYSQKKDTIRLVHTNYTTVFNTKLKYPVLVEWWETKAKVSCKNSLQRKDNFKPDPLLYNETDIADYYVNSGYDRGHLCPAASNECLTTQVLSECFYYSNMAPQTHNLNAGTWKILEELTRQKAIEKDSIHVWAGALGNKGKMGKITIPEKFWKVIFIKSTGEWFAYIFDNTKVKDPLGLPPHIVKVSDVEKLTQIKIK